MSREEVEGNSKFGCSDGLCGADDCVTCRPDDNVQEIISCDGCLVEISAVVICPYCDGDYCLDCQDNGVCKGCIGNHKIEDLYT